MVCCVCLGRRLFGMILLNGCMGSGALAAVVEEFAGLGRVAGCMEAMRVGRRGRGTCQRAGESRDSDRRGGRSQ